MPADVGVAAGGTGVPARPGGPDGPRARRAHSWVRDASPTMRCMFAMIWHYWIGVVLAVGAVATIASVGANYLRKVESTRYPKGR